MCRREQGDRRLFNWTRGTTAVGWVTAPGTRLSERRDERHKGRGNTQQPNAGDVWQRHRTWAAPRRTKNMTSTASWGDCAVGALRKSSKGDSANPCHGESTTGAHTRGVEFGVLRCPTTPSATSSSRQVSGVPFRLEPGRRDLRGQDPQRRQTGRPAHRATDELRAGHQPQATKALGLTIPPSLLRRADTQGFITLDSLVRRSPYTAGSGSPSRPLGARATSPRPPRWIACGPPNRSQDLDSIGHSLSLGANELADALDTFFLNVVSEAED
jgi:hypothetical protein